MPAHILLIGVSAIALTVGAVAARAQGQPTSGFYVGGAAGANILEDNRFRNGGGNSTDGYDAGYAGTLDFGYGLGNGIRLEIEPGYRNNAVDRVNGRLANSRMQSATLMGTVTGHTDTVGTGSYNLVLSRRRATAVRAQLIRDGVSGNLISTSGVGQNDLAVQTGPNVNEPRSRRVEITVQAPGM